ncbi:hypothetical protein AALA00_09990 [Lachnospiraceae bacterium 46-15]
MRDGKYASNSKRTKSVTRLPGWILRIKGKLDSKKGKGVCDEYIHHLSKRLVVMESAEVIRAENGLFEDRKKAAAVLAGFSEQKELLDREPDGRQKGSDVEAIRANRKDAERKEAARSGLRDGIENLTVINEQIINTDTVLDERINKMRSKAAEKIHAYVVGIRCGELREYTCDLSAPEDSAREIYIAKHRELNEKIRMVIAGRGKEDAV